VNLSDDMSSYKYGEIDRMDAAICFLFGTLDFEKTAGGNLILAWALRMCKKVILTIIYLTVSCVSWWFGDRWSGSL